MEVLGFEAYQASKHIETYKICRCQIGYDLLGCLNLNTCFPWLSRCRWSFDTVLREELPGAYQAFDFMGLGIAKAAGSPAWCQKKIPRLGLRMCAVIASASDASSPGFPLPYLLFGAWGWRGLQGRSQEGLPFQVLSCCLVLLCFNRTLNCPSSTRADPGSGMKMTIAGRMRRSLLP